MERIGLVGTTWRQGGAENLASLVVPTEERDDWLVRTADRVGAEELVYLATCNRVELLYVSRDETPVAMFRPRLFEALFGRAPASGEAERALRAWAGEGAVEHLLVVAAGLDSARIGEPEITGQVKLALERSRALGLVGPRLELVFDEAFALARRVRRETGLGQGRHSLAEIAVDPIRAHLGDRPGHVAVVGTSQMCRRAALALVRGREGHRVTVVNRTPARAAALAAEAGADLISLDQLRADPPALDALVLATAAPGPVLDRAALQRLADRVPAGRTLLAIDLAVPPDIAIEDARAAGITRIGMDELLASAEAARSHHEDAARRGRELVDESLAELPRRLVDRVLSPLFAAVQERYRQTAAEGMQRLLRKELAGLGESERAAVEGWAETLARRFAHLPTAGLRSVAAHGGMPAVDAFLEHADGRLLSAYGQALAAARNARGMKADIQEEEDAIRAEDLR